MSQVIDMPELLPSLREADDPHLIRTLPILVLLPHNRCNCRCVMCDIWKIRQTRELTTADLAPHLDSMRALKVRWVVLSGGEPLLHSDLAALAGLLRGERIRVTLLTAGLVLDRFARAVAEGVDDIIVSLDGPPAVHDDIRRVPRAFDRLAAGVRAVRSLRPSIPVCARCTVQKGNFRYLGATVRAAWEMKLNSISFLAGDVTSEAFNRPQGWSPERQGCVALDAREVEDLEAEVDALLRNCRMEIDSGFIVESEDKLRRIVLHFRAQLGQILPASPRCNAPWVSAVVEADGAVRPCFFHPPLGKLQDAPLHELLNSAEALNFRRRLVVSSDPVCRRCVCPLFLSPGGAD